jgi:spermidine synthase
MSLLRRAMAKRQPEQMPVAISEERGIRYLHFGSEAIQGAMRISAPTKLELEYTRDMVAALLLQPAPTHVGIIGLGAGSVAKWVVEQVPHAMIAAIEISPAVVQVARTYFSLPAESARFRVIEADGQTYLAAHEGSFDLLLVDVYDAQATGPVLASPEFYALCAARLSGSGVLSVNLFGKHKSYETNLRNIDRAFAGRCLALPASARGNVIALAWGPQARVEAATLRELGREWQARTGVGFVRYASLMKEAGFVVSG